MPKSESNEPAPESGRLPFEVWAAQLGTPAWALAATQMGQNWPQGQELTRDAYQEAVALTTGTVLA